MATKNQFLHASRKCKCRVCLWVGRKKKKKTCYAVPLYARCYITSDRMYVQYIICLSVFLPINQSINQIKHVSPNPPKKHTHANNTPLNQFSHSFHFRFSNFHNRSDQGLAFMSHYSLKTKQSSGEWGDFWHHMIYCTVHTVDSHMHILTSNVQYNTRAK